MRALLWQVIAWIVTRPWVSAWLILQAYNTPYSHIRGRDGDLYMGRWWLFNPYPEAGAPQRWIHRLPSVRIHWIRRRDMDRHRHDHPWNARTIILRGWYCEERELSSNGAASCEYMRLQGFTGTLNFGEYHRITEVCRDGAWTLFITWKKQGSWGFNVDGVKVPWRQYLGINP